MYRDILVVEEENKLYPKNADRQVVSPRYTPPGSSYLSEWRLWCKQTPKDRWPDWLKTDIAEMRVKRA